MRTIDLIIVFIYVLAMLGIGVYSRTQVKSMDDFMLGGRRFKKFALIGTIMATMVGSGMTMGAVGTVYKGDIPGVFWMYLGFGLGLLLFAFLAGKVRATQKRTMAEVIGQGFGKSPRIVAAIIVIAYAIGLVAINIAGLRTLIIAIFGESLTLSIPVVTVLAAAIAIIYTSLGGFYAVVITDQIQLVIMLVGVFVLGPIIGLSNAGGFGEIANAYKSVNIDFFNIMPAEFLSWGGLGIFLAYFFAVPGDPTMPQRALASKDTKSAKTAFLVSGVMGLLFGAVLIIIGGSAFTLLPGIESGDTVLPSFILSYYPPVIAGITIAGAAAAVMSSFDSFLILATSHTAYDLGRTINPDLSENTIKKAMPILTIAIGLIGIIIALYITSLFNYLWMLFSLVGASLIPAFVGSLFFKSKVSDIGLSASMIAGLAITGYGYATWNEAVLLFGDPLTTGLICATIALVAFSFIGKKGVVKSS